MESEFCPGWRILQLSVPASLQGAGMKDWQGSSAQICSQDSGKMKGIQDQRSSLDSSQCLLAFGVHSGMALLCHPPDQHQKGMLKVLYQ